VGQTSGNTAFRPSQPKSARSASGRGGVTRPYRTRKVFGTFFLHKSEAQPATVRAGAPGRARAWAKLREMWPSSSPSPKVPVRPPGGMAPHPPIGPGIFLVLLFDINRKHNPLQRARGRRAATGRGPNFGKCGPFPALTTQKRPFGDLEGWCRTPYIGQEIFCCFFPPKSGAQTATERAGARGEGALATPFPAKKSPVGGQGSTGRAAICRLEPVLER
jgi:hypothetical protein